MGNQNAVVRQIVSVFLNKSLSLLSYFFFVIFIFYFANLSAETWNVDSDGNWNVAGNWNPAAVPNDPGATATFGSVITAPRTITCGNYSIDTLNIDSSNAYDLSGGGSLRLYNAINVTNINGNASHSINLGTVLNNDCTVTVTLDPAYTFTIGQTFGDYGIIKEGSGTLQTNTSSSTYSGGITLSEGTLLLVRAGAGTGIIAMSDGTTLAIGSAVIDTDIPNNVTLAGTNTINADSGIQTLSGVLSSSGNLTKSGVGILALSNDNTYSGGTTLSAGTLSLAANTGAGTGTVAMSDGTALALGSAIAASNNVTLAGTNTINVDSGTGTLSGILSSSGNLTKTGLGILAFSNDNTYSGATNVNAGTLIVNGSIASSSLLTVKNSSTLQGTGTVGVTTVNSGGTVIPGNSVGTLNVSGNFTFETGSTYQVEIDGDTEDLIAIIGGQAIIEDGANLHVTIDNFIAGNEHTIITATGGISKSVADPFNVTGPNATLVGDVVYNTNDVVLNLSVGSFTNTVPASSGNPGAVAAYLDTLPTQPLGSDLENVLDVLAILPADQMTKALDLLQVAPYKCFYLSQHNILNVKNIIQKKSNEFYQNYCVRNIKCKKKVSVWVDPYGAFLSQNDDKGVVGSDIDSAGVVAGSDFMIIRNLYFGLSGAYSYSSIDLHDKRGKGDVNSFYGGLYTSYHHCRFFINGSMLGAYNRYKGHRNIVFSSINRKATNKHSGGEFLAHIDTGVICVLRKSFELKPFIAGDYVYLRENGYTEKNADSLNLKVKRQNYNTFRFEGGTNLGVCYKVCGQKILPDLKLTYIREKQIDGKYYTSNLVDQPGSFKVVGINSTRNIISPGASITTYFYNEKCKFAIRYDGEFAKNYSNNLVNIELAAQF